MNMEATCTVVGGVALVFLLGTLAILDVIPVPSKIDKHEGCTLTQSVKTDELKYCGKACLIPLYVNTWQCGTETRVLIETN